MEAHNMIRQFLICSFSILTMMLSSAQDYFDSIIIGNWNSCDRDGSYIEFYISDSIIDINYDDFYPTSYHTYNIHHDSLTINYFSNSSYTYTWQIQLINNNEIWLVSHTDTGDYSDTTKLTRIMESILLPPEFKSLKQQLKWYDKYYTPYYIKRRENKKCEDIRSMDEIKNDTIHILEMDSSLELELNPKRRKK